MREASKHAELEAAQRVQRSTKSPQRAIRHFELLTSSSEDRPHARGLVVCDPNKTGPGVIAREQLEQASNRLLSPEAACGTARAQELEQGLAIVGFLVGTFGAMAAAPLVAIAVLTTITFVWQVTVPTVGDQGELPDALPVLGIPNVPLTAETFMIILPYALALAAVGLLESLLTARLVDDITEVRAIDDRDAHRRSAQPLRDAQAGESTTDDEDVPHAPEAYRDQ